MLWGLYVVSKTWTGLGRKEIRQATSFLYCSSSPRSSYFLVSHFWIFLRYVTSGPQYRWFWPKQNPYTSDWSYLPLKASNIPGPQMCTNRRELESPLYIAKWVLVPRQMPAEMESSVWPRAVVKTESLALILQVRVQQIIPTANCSGTLGDISVPWMTSLVLQVTHTHLSPLPPSSVYSPLREKFL